MTKRCPLASELPAVQKAEVQPHSTCLNVRARIDNFPGSVLGNLCPLKFYTRHTTHTHTQEVHHQNPLLGIKPTRKGFKNAVVKNTFNFAQLILSWIHLTVVLIRLPVEMWRSGNGCSLQCVTPVCTCPVISLAFIFSLLGKRFPESISPPNFSCSLWSVLLCHTLIE